MCQVLGVSKSGYYKWLNGEPSKRTIENQDLTHKIRDIHARSRRTYGSPRITEDLRAQGTEVSRVRVARLMRRANIRSEIPKKFKVTTDSRHEYPVADNLLDRNFQPGEIGQACVSDITYIWTKQGWLYLTVILDLAMRKVIGWSLSQTLNAQQTSIAAFNMALQRQPICREMIFHSDRGVQYACSEFRQLLASYPLIRQ